MSYGLDRRRLAAHECGHAVAGWMLDRVVTMVTLDCSEQRLGGPGQAGVRRRVRVLFPLDQSNWTKYADVLATIDDRDTWLAVSTAYTAFAAVTASEHTVVTDFVPTLAQEADAAVEALRPHV